MAVERASVSLRVECVFALPDAADVISLEVPAGTTLRGVIERARIPERCPAFDWSTVAVGVYGRVRSFDDLVGEGDRVEVYRPLPVDPKEARRVRSRRSG